MYGVTGVCAGLDDCHADYVNSGVCPAGCVVVPGVCRDSGLLCNTSLTGVPGGCASGDECLGLDCSGFVNCADYNVAECDGHSGCSLTDCDGYHSYNNSFGSGASCSEHNPPCVWNCSGSVSYVEVCSNGIDDDGINGVDCLDSYCQHGGTWTDAEVSSGRYNCLGTNQTGDKTGNSYYCGVGDTDPSVGLCCPVGQRPVHAVLTNKWYCQDYAPCNPSPPYSCAYDYSSDFDSWLSSTYSGPGDADWCIDVSGGLACCKVVEFGNEEYYSDVGNVVVY